jgi:hypothetical protein
LAPATGEGVAHYNNIIIRGWQAVKKLLGLACANASEFCFFLIFDFFCEHDLARRFAITIPWLSYCWKTHLLLSGKADCV